MRTITKTVYKLEELTPQAQEAARQKFAETNDFDTGAEYMASLKALAAHFGGKLANWQISWDEGGYSSAEFRFPSDDGDEPMSGREILRRLRALGSFNRRTLKGKGDCKLTGWCYDEEAIDGFRWAFYREGKRDLHELMEAAFRGWLKSAQDECEYQNSMEAFKEAADANDWEYYENGEML
jgi:hypothetical protein